MKGESEGNRTDPISYLFLRIAFKVLRREWASSDTEKYQFQMTPNNWESG